MQTIKEELRTLILKKAEQEFLLQGFHHASLRNIAKEAGTTIGNLYHYFPNKEALFHELVKDEYRAFTKLLEHNDNEKIQSELPNSLHPDDNIAWRESFHAYLTTFMPFFTKRFLLLIDRSQGTQYQNARNNILDLLQLHIEQHFNEQNLRITAGFTQVLAEQLLTGLLYIVEHYDDKEQKQLLISDMFAFFIEGTMHFS